MIIMKCNGCKREMGIDEPYVKVYLDMKTYPHTFTFSDDHLCQECADKLCREYNVKIGGAYGKVGL